jgi:hypothetical protein
MHHGVDIRSTSATQRRNRRRYQRAIVETLEPRVLLTAFSAADMNGTWAFHAMNLLGSIQFDNTHNIVDGALHTDDDLDIVPAGNFTISAAGAVTIIANGFTYTGAMNAAHDTIVLTQQSSTTSQLDNVLTVLTRSDGTGFANSDVSGTWNIFLNGDDPQSTGSGTVLFDGNGHITGGSVVEFGVTTNVAGGSYSVNDSGNVDVTLILGSTASGTTLTLTSQLNTTKDLISQSPTDIVTAASDSDVRLMLLVRSSGTYSKTDLTGSWTLLGDGFSGNIVFDGKGKITGGTGHDDDGDPFTLSGSYSIVTSGSAAGMVTLTVTNLPTAGAAGPFVVKGFLNAHKNTLAIVDTPFNNTTSGESSADSMILLVNSSNHTPTLTSVTPFSTAIAAHPFAFTYDDLLAKTNAFDIDSQTLSFNITAVTKGSLSVNGSAVHTFPTTIVAGDNLVWTPDATAKGAVAAFSITASDGIATTSKAVPVVFTTVLTPTITLSVTKPTANEVNGTASGMGLFTITRANGILTSPLTVTLTVGGTATNGTDYNTISTHVNFSANQTKVTIPINVINDAIAEGKETVIVTVVGTDAAEIYNIGAAHAGTVSITDAASTISVSASKTKASEFKGTTTGIGQFTVSRTGGDLSIPQVVHFTLSGAATANGLTSHITITPVTNILTFDTTNNTGTIKILAKQKTAVIPFTSLNDNLADTPAPSVILTVNPDSSTSSYFIATANHATINIADAAPTVSVTAAKSLPIVNGSVSRLGQFTILRTGLDLTTTQNVVFELSGSAVDLAGRFTSPSANSTAVAFDTVSNIGTLTLFPGQKSGVVTVNPTDHAAANATADAMILTLVADGGPSYFIDPLHSAAAGDRTSTFSATITKGKASEINGSTSGMGQFTIVRTGGDLNRPVTVDFSIGGTSSAFGLPGSNFNIITSAKVTFDAHTIGTSTGTVTFDAGVKSVNIPFNSLDDLHFDTPLSQGGPDVHLVLSQDAAHTFLVDPAKTTSDIIIADAASLVSAFAVKNGSEVNGTSSGVATFSFLRAGGNLKAPLTVFFNLGGSATEGTDYETVSPHSVTFAANKTTATLSIKIKDDVTVDANETIDLILQPDLSTFGYAIDIANSTPEVTIANDTRSVIFGPVTNLSGTHGTLVLTYSDLLAATNAQVPAGGALTFKVTKVLKGSVTIPLNTSIGTSQTFAYVAPIAGTYKAFNVVALNGTNATSTITLTIQAT